MKPNKVENGKPRKSLRTILMVWFFLFSVVPLAFVTTYSVFKYEQALDNEVAQRLRGNAREISVILSDFRTNLLQLAEQYSSDPTIRFHLSTAATDELKATSRRLMTNELATSLSFFAWDGRMLVSSYRGPGDGIKTIAPNRGDGILLTQKFRDGLKKQKHFSRLEFDADKEHINLVVVTKVTRGKSNRLVGYIEQILELGAPFLDGVRGRLNLEIAMINPKGEVVAASHSDFKLYPTNFFPEQLNKDKPDSYFELEIRGIPYGFLLQDIEWGNSHFLLGIATSKKEALEVLKNVNYAFYTVVGAVVLLLIVTIIIISNVMLKPMYDLLRAIRGVQEGGHAAEIPIKSNTELGLLTESFNEMTRRVSEAQRDLKRKINELEETNQELKDAQTKLVHSAKMVSLGQLVAGVAHELNNPIGFIYSNMNHLKEYSEQLIEMVDTAEKSPKKLGKLIEEYDLEYIREDLPKLIKSCEEGARRTRDIVVGLRSFSRLEEAKLKEVNIHDGLDNTLNLISGELKNRVKVIKDYGDIPHIHCYASQINQVFMNILSNACQAIDGEGKIWISTRRRDEDSIEVSIQDSGKGIPKDVIEKIFDPFYTTKGVGKGTGLGMSISYGIIAKHGGDIHIQSKVGVGTEFVITLPVNPAAIEM